MIFLKECQFSSDYYSDEINAVLKINEDDDVNNDNNIKSNNNDNKNKNNLELLLETI